MSPFGRFRHWWSRLRVGQGMVMFAALLALVGVGVAAGASRPGRAASPAAPAFSPAALPDIRVGGSEQVRITGLRSAPAAGGVAGSAVAREARLHLALSKTAVDVPVSLTRGADGALGARLEQLDLPVAGARITLLDVAVGAERLVAAGGQIRLPGRFGARTFPLDSVTFDRDGLRINRDNTFRLDGAQFGLGSDAGFPTRNLVGRLSREEGGLYRIALEGDTQIAVGGGSASARGRMVIRDNGVVVSSVAPFPISIVGFTVDADETTVDPDGTIRAPKATMIAPEGFGGFRISLSNVLYFPSTQTIFLGATKVKLPMIKIKENFKLGLEGELLKDAAGWYFKILGSFQLPLEGSLPIGCSGIQIGGAIRLNSSNMAAVTFQSPQPTAVSLAGLSGTLGLLCEIPIPGTGFNISKIAGTVSLMPDDVSISVTMGIATTEKIPPLGAIASAEGTVRVSAMPIGYAATTTVKLLGMEAAQTKWEISAAPRYHASMFMQTLFWRGGLEVNAWLQGKSRVCNVAFCTYPDGAEFYLTIRGYVTVGFKSGSWGFLGLPWWDFDLAGASLEGGRFKSGKWGAKGEASFLWFKVGFYVDETGALLVNQNLDQYQLATPAQVAAARQRWLAAKRAGATDAQLAALDRRFSFTPQGVVIVNAPEITRTSELYFGLTRQSGSTGGISLIAPDGAEVTSANAQSFPGVHFTSNVTATAGTAYEVFVVETGQPGWKAKLNIPDGEAYHLDLYQRPIAVAVADTSLSSDAATATVGWTLKTSTPTTVTLYLSDLATEQNGDIVGNAIPFEPFQAETDGSPDALKVDLADLPSGAYRVMLRFEDGYHMPVDTVLAQTLTVDHSASWPKVWTPAITVTNEYAGAWIEWDELSHPDLDGYTVYLRTPPGGDDLPLGATEAFTNETEIEVGFENLTPGQVYYLSVGATRGAHGAEVRSREVVLRPLAAPFELAAAQKALTVQAGDTALLGVTVTTPLDEYPEGVSFYSNCLGELPPTNAVYLPLVRARGALTDTASAHCTEDDGFDVVLDSDEDVVVPTQAGEAARLAVSVPEGLEPGVYVLPIRAYGGGASRDFSVTVTVLEAPEAQGAR